MLGFSYIRSSRFFFFVVVVFFFTKTNLFVSQLDEHSLAASMGFSCYPTELMDLFCDGLLASKALNCNNVYIIVIICT